MLAAEASPPRTRSGWVKKVQVGWCRPVGGGEGVGRARGAGGAGGDCDSVKGVNDDVDLPPRGRARLPLAATRQRAREAPLCERPPAERR